MAVDPICGMTVDEAHALSAERDGNIAFFCSEPLGSRHMIDRSVLRRWLFALVAPVFG